MVELSGSGIGLGSAWLRTMMAECWLGYPGRDGGGGGVLGLG